MARLAQRTKLSRKRDQRRALIKSLAESLIMHESIVTTKPKAKALQPYIEKLITKAKQDGQHQRRLVRSKLSTDASTEKLFTEIAPRFAKRPGGYTRVKAAGWRRGDDAELARISLVDTKEAGAPVETVAAPATEEKAPKAATPTAAKPKTPAKTKTAAKKPAPKAKSAPQQTKPKKESA